MELIKEITLRHYEKSTKKTERELIRKMCLSIGLLQPEESRDIIIDILYVLLNAKKQKKKLTIKEIKNKVVETRKKHRLSSVGISSSNIRRQIYRLRDLLIIERGVKNAYRITEFLSLSEIFEEKINGFLIPYLVKGIKKHFKEVDKKFKFN